MNQVFPNGAVDQVFDSSLPLDELGRSPRDPIRRQQAVVAMGRRAVALPELSILLEDAARLMVEMLEADFGGVAECPREERPSLWFVRRGEQVEEGRRRYTLTAASDDSLAAHTISAGCPVVLSDLARETRFRDPLLKRFNVRSALSVPLTLHDRPFGALAAYRADGRPFSSEDVLFAETIGHLVSTTIARQRAEEVLASQQRFQVELLSTVEALVLLLDREGRIESLNRAGQQVTGFTSEELRGRALWTAFLTPQETDTFRTTLVRLERGESPVEIETTLITKHSGERTIAWTFGAVRSAAGGLESVVATGIDITRLRAAEEKAEKATTIGSDRRQRQRQSFPYEQMVAPLTGGELPARDKFGPVKCHDIAPGGFSFVAPGPPSSDSFVVALGTGAGLTYLIAQVAHVTRFEQNGERMYLVGCNYVGRAEY